MQCCINRLNFSQFAFSMALWLYQAPREKQDMTASRNMTEA